MKLKHVAELVAGGTPDTNDSRWWSHDTQGFPWVAISDMSGRGAVAKTQKQLTQDGLDAKGLPWGHPGTVLFAMYASVGEVSTLAISASWNQALLGLTARHDRADNRFIAYWLRHFAPLAISQARTATQANLNAEQVSNFPFPRHTLAEQRRIADFLDDRVARIDQIIAARRQQQQDARDVSKAQVASAVRNEEDTVVPCRARVDIRLGRQRSPEHEQGDHMMPYLRSANITDGRVLLDDVKRMNFSLQEQPVFALTYGDVLVTEGSASPEAVGAAAAWRSELPGIVCFQNTLLRLRPKRGYAPDFLEVWARAAHYAKAPQAFASGASILHLGAEGMGRIPIPIIDEQEQRRRVDRAKEAFRAGDLGQRLINRSIELLTEYKSSLITAAVTGELDVTTASRRIPGE